MKEYQPFTCICCAQPALTRVGGWWCHKECFQKTREMLKQASFEVPLIAQNIVMSSRKCLEASILSMGSDMDKFEAIRKSVNKKAWKIFHERHPTPWIVDNP